VIRDRIAMSEVRRIPPRDAQAKLVEGYVYVDVRTEPEFEEGHPEGALNVPFLVDGPGGRAKNPEFLRVINALFPRDAKLIVGCKTGGRSLRAAQELVADGYTDVFDQRAGWDGARDAFGKMTEPGWSLEDLPAEAGPSDERGYVSLKKKAGLGR
jgi:rhodanese-related sulfurtransferase